MTILKAKETIVLAGIRLVESGLIARTWGNISCRISSSHFLITPSGRDYLSLTPEEIVEVRISDCTYSGNIKPSSEKGIHAEVYMLHPEINFVIHTHQDNASVVSALEFDSIKVPKDFPHLQGEVICAAYGLPGTKKLRRGVAQALSQAKGNAVIMKNHGALCFGRDYEETFQVANELENACDGFIREQYLKLSKQSVFNPLHMGYFALAKLTEKVVPEDDNINVLNCESERTYNGFKLQIEDIIFDVIADQTEKILPVSASLHKEAEIHNSIYKNNKNINNIIHADTEGIIAASSYGITLLPFLDDFAQIVGTSVINERMNAQGIVKALKKHSAVMIKNNGALCCGISKSDASAVCQVMEKNCRTIIGTALFKKVKPINRFECLLMRFVYLKKYSKELYKK